MAVELKVGSTVSAKRRELKAIHRRQIPFATMNALNSTAFAIRKEIVYKTWPRGVTVRAKGLANAAFRVAKAPSKRRLIASVYDRLKRALFALQAEGGQKTPHRGANLAIPSKNIKRTSTGKIGKAKQPSALKGSFKADLKGKGFAIWQRIGRGARRLRLAYELEPSAAVPQAFDFYQDATRIALADFPRELDRSLAYAISRAR